MNSIGRRAALLALCAALSGCIPQGIAFRVDTRVTVLAPEPRATVTLPVRIDWDVRDFTVVPPGSSLREDAGYFAVFVDSAPVPPGEPLSRLARKDAGCRTTPGCPDREYLRTRGVYTTTDTELLLQELPPGAAGRRERHRATIVLLDASGSRLGESAFQIVFDVDREATP